ncbi:MAG: rhamnulokinase [Ruminococcus sp.]|nr:rhamnulokinase [Ruminococcus sp.]
MNKKVLAIDFGASSGRAILGTFDGEKISLKEIHRFSNDPVMLNGTMYWDFLRLFHEIKQSLIKSKAYGNIDSMAIDTWGVDFGLIDINGNLLENPVHYRDNRTMGMLDKAFEKISKDELYSITGNQFMEINTAFQLLSMSEKRPELLKRADKLLLMPDLFNYYLTGKIFSEQSIASTTQLFDAKRKDWSMEVINRLGIKDTIFPKIIKSGTYIGDLSESICIELDIKPMKVFSVCGHDTQLAMVSTPATEKDFIFLSCGTWSLFGTELDNPILNEKSLNLNVTNELGFGERTSFLKNIIGLWLIQESRRQWQREGKDYSFMDLESLAKKSEPFKCFINPDAPEFIPSGNVPKRIQEFCKKTGQYIPQSVGEIMRCIYESLALKYRLAKVELETCTNKSFNTIYMVGGGTKDTFLSQLTACACDCRVSSGPIEATAFGNIAVQLMADGSIKDISQARDIIKNSEDIIYFEPTNSQDWNVALDSYKKIQ